MIRIEIWLLERFFRNFSQLRNRSFSAICALRAHRSIFQIIAVDNFLGVEMTSQGQSMSSEMARLEIEHDILSNSVVKSLTALFGMRHLTYWTNFLHLFAFLVSRPPQSTLLHCHAPTLLRNRWLACLIGSSILVLKLTFSPDPFSRNLPLSLTDWFHGFYPARVRKSLALKTLVSAAD